jgi:type II secretory pathway pseudopilin PulG
MLKSYILSECYFLKKCKTTKIKAKSCNYHFSPVLKAFSLAEVLITLLIVGTISSIVIPNIIADTQQAEYKTALKKQTSVLAQAFKRVLNDNAGSITNIAPTQVNSWNQPGTNIWYTQFLVSKDASNLLGNSFAQYLSVTKTCNLISLGTRNTNCFPKLNKRLNGTILSSGGYYPYYSMVLNDGSQISFNYSYSGCTNKGVPCGEIMLDINGNMKGPNQWGKDIYFFYLFASIINPYGSNGDFYDRYRITSHYGCDLAADSQAMGYTCAADYLKQ